MIPFELRLLHVTMFFRQAIKEMNHIDVAPGCLPSGSGLAAVASNEANECTAAVLRLQAGYGSNCNRYLIVLSVLPHMQSRIVCQFLHSFMSHAIKM